jgi:hypothetical protein
LGFEFPIDPIAALGELSRDRLLMIVQALGERASLDRGRRLLRSVPERVDQSDENQLEAPEGDRNLPGRPCDADDGPTSTGRTG